MKSVTICRNVDQLLNLGHLEPTKSNFKKKFHSRSEQTKLEKGWFGGRLRSFTL